MADGTVTERLMRLSDVKYAAFQGGLMPTVAKERVLGVRMPAIRRLARELRGSAEEKVFLNALPHRFYDEDALHAVLLDGETNFDAALAATKRFLPYIDSWGTCDILAPAGLRGDLDRLLVHIERWLQSEHIYTVRFGLVRLTAWYVKEPHYLPRAMELAAAARGDDYYIRMAQAWFFSMALVHGYEAALPYLTEHRLPTWVHNKAIQKTIESRCPSDETKQYLRTLKRKKEDTL